MAAADLLNTLFEHPEVHGTLQLVMVAFLKQYYFQFCFSKQISLSLYTNMYRFTIQNSLFWYVIGINIATTQLILIDKWLL